MAYLNPTAGERREGGFSTTSLDAGTLSADAAGRALIASGFFNTATASDKFAAQSIARTLLGLRVVEAHTAGDTLLAAESGSIHTTTGASGTVTFALPAAVVGLEYGFYVGAAQELRIDPNGSETISLPSTGVAGGGGKYLTADAIGETVHIVCAKAGTWAIVGFTGTWTAEP